MLATLGGSPTKPGEVALLAVETVDQLLSAEPSHWETLRKSSNMEVGVSLLEWPVYLSCAPLHMDGASHFIPYANNHWASPAKRKRACALCCRVRII